MRKKKGSQGGISEKRFLWNRRLCDAKKDIRWGSLPCHLTLNWNFEGGFPKTCTSCPVNLSAPVCCQSLMKLYLEVKVFLFIAVQVTEAVMFHVQPLLLLRMSG